MENHLILLEIKGMLWVDSTGRRVDSYSHHIPHPSAQEMGGNQFVVPECYSQYGTFDMSIFASHTPFLGSLYCSAELPWVFKRVSFFARLSGSARSRCRLPVSSQILPGPYLAYL